MPIIYRWESEVVVRHYDSVLEARVRSERLLLVIFRLIASTLNHYIDPATHHLRYFASYSARAMSTDWTFQHIRMRIYQTIVMTSVGVFSQDFMSQYGASSSS
jgi:hypothetical protein